MQRRRSDEFCGSCVNNDDRSVCRERVSKYDWEAVSQELSSYGCAVMKKLLSPEECREIAQFYDDEARFRSHVHMGRPLSTPR